MATAHTIDRYLELDDEHFPEALLRVTVSEEARRRAAKYAEKSNFGTITEEEQAEYLRIIELDEVLAVLHARARGLLSTDH